MADAFHQGQRVLGASQRDAGVVDDRVEVLHAECHACRGAELADALQRAQRGGPHLAASPVPRAGGLAVDQLCGVQVQPWNTKRLSGFDGQLRGPHDFVGGGRVDQVAVQVAGHRREPGAGVGQRLQVLVVPAPDLDREAHLVDAPDPVDDRQVREDHLGADRQVEAAHRSAAFRATGAAVSTDSRAARAISRAMRASAPVTDGSMPACTQSTKWANCAT